MTFEALSQHLEAFLALKRAHARKESSADACGMKGLCSAAFLNDGGCTDVPGRLVRSSRWTG